MAKVTGFLKRSRAYEVIRALILGGYDVPTNLVFTFSNSDTQYATFCKIDVCNAEGLIIPGVHNLRVWTSDAADGAGLAGTDPNGTVAPMTAGGTELGVLTAKKAFDVITLADGSFTLEIKDDSSPVLLYVAACIPSIGVAEVSRKTVAGDYTA